MKFIGDDVNETSTGSGTVNLTGDVTSSGNATTLSAAQTNITSIFATDLIIGEDDQTCIDFGTPNSIKLKLNNTDEITIAGHSMYPTSDNGIALGTSSKGWSDLWLASGAVINWDGGGYVTSFANTIYIGINSNGNDVQIRGGTSGSYLFWDESIDNLSAQGGATITATTAVTATTAATAITAITSANVTTNANLTGDVTSLGNATTIASAQTNITSIFAAGLVIGEDSETCIDFGTPDEIDFKINNVTEISLSASSIYPTTNDGISLGSATNMWSDLFLAYGATINFAGGDVIFTHSPNTLVFGASGNGSDFICFGDTSTHYLMWDASSNNLQGHLGATITATTAASLTTPRAINGVDFDGSAPITVTSAGSTLSDTVPVSKGGTGNTTLASDSILTGNGASAITAESELSFSSSLNTLYIGADNGDIMNIKRKDHGNGGGGTLSIKGSNGGGTNSNAGVLKFYGGQSTGTGNGGDIEFWTAAAGGTSGSSLNGFGFLSRLKIDADGGITISGDLNILGSITSTSDSLTHGDATIFGNDIVFEGTTDDAHEATLSGGNPTSDITITLPASTGILALQNEDTTGNAATATYATSAGSATLAGGVLSVGNLSGDVTSVNRVTTIADDSVTEDKLANTLLAEIDANTAKVDLTVDGSGTVHANNYTDTIYTHPNHSGDVTSTADGVTVISAASVHHSMLNDDIITGQGAHLVPQQDDEFLIYDRSAGTVNKIAFTDFEDEIFGNVSGDATVAAGGALTIADDSITEDKLGNTILAEIDANTLKTTSTGSITAATSIFNAALSVGYNATSAIDFSTANKIKLVAGGNTMLTIRNDSVVPGSTNPTLGSTSAPWPSLVLDDGGVINFNSGDITLTHTANTLTLAGGTLVSTLTGDVTGNADTATALTSGAKTIDGLLTLEGNLRVGGANSTGNNWVSIDCQNGTDSTGGGISFYETGAYDVDTPQYGAKIVYNEVTDTLSIGTIQNNVYLKQLSFIRNLSRTYVAGDLFVSDVSPLIYVTDTSTVVTSGDTLGTVAFKNEDDDSTTARLKVIATEDHASGTNGGSKWEFMVTPDGTSTEVAALTIGQDKSLTVEGTIELGDASDTTIARSGAGTVTIAGNEVQLQGTNTGQYIEYPIRDLGTYLFYLYHDDYWYSAGTSTMAILGTSTAPGAISSTNSKYQSRLGVYTAMEACTLKKLTFTFYWYSSTVSTADIDFGFSKFNPITDGTAASIPMNAITATDHNGTYTENKPYQVTFTFSGNNGTLAAGDAFAFHMRTTGGVSSQRITVYGGAVLSIELN